MSRHSLIYTIAPPKVQGENKRSSCRGCLYRRPLGSNSSYTVCHYLIDTGKPRGCPVDRCDKKVMRKRVRRHAR